MQFPMTFNLDVLKSLKLPCVAPIPLEIVGTKEAIGKLRKASRRRYTEVDPLFGVRLTVLPDSVDENMIRSGRIIQKDRFAEYSAADMVWAEPLGLAEWEMVSINNVMWQFTGMKKIGEYGMEMQLRQPQ
jgi:hypothetical protein